MKLTQKIANERFENVKHIKKHHFAEYNEIAGGTFAGSDIVSVELPDWLEVIPESMFFNCQKLKKVVLPKNLKIIGEFAFWSCFSLKHIYLPDTLEFIKSNAFEYSGLKDIVVPENIEIIESLAFNNCRNLETVDMRGEKLQNIGTMCFGRCHSIDKISIRSAQVVESYAFDFYNETKNFAKLFRKSQIAYKGFNKDATGISCRLHYYTPFRKETCENPEMCIRGFHACMNPLSVFNYYAGTKKEYRKVFLEGKICNSENADTKVCAGEITVSDKIDISEMCRIYSNAPKYIVPLCVSKTIERFISFVHRI